MRSWNGRWIILVQAVAVVACLGCRGEDRLDEEEPSGGPIQEEPVGQEASVAEVVPVEEPPPPPTIPQVLLTDALRRTCLVFKDDSMPEAELSDLDGQKQSLGELFGEKLSVVFFWTRGNTEFSPLAAQLALEDLQGDVYQPYSEKGVQVVAINEGDAPEAVKELVEEAGATFANLLDPDGALLAQVATEKLPRIYLLDAEGKILWLDLAFFEFSGITRKNLLQAIQVALGEIGGR